MKRAVGLGGPDLVFFVCVFCCSYGQESRGRGVCGRACAHMGPVEPSRGRVWLLSVSLGPPDSLVLSFDEIHFGRFAAHYLGVRFRFYRDNERTITLIPQGHYFFDLHPPLGKLIFAAVGKLIQKKKNPANST